MNRNLEQIKITVTKHTAEILREQEQNLRLTTGEIIDRLILKTSICNTDFASLNVCDYLFLIARDQTKDQFEETMLKTAALILTTHAECYCLTFEQEMLRLKSIYEKFQIEAGRTRS